MYFPITIWALDLASFHNARMPRSQVMITGATQLAQGLQEAMEPSSQLGHADAAFDANEAPHLPLGVHIPWHAQSEGTGPNFFRTDLPLTTKLSTAIPDPSLGPQCLPNCKIVVTRTLVDLLLPKVRHERSVPPSSPASGYQPLAWTCTCLGISLSTIS